MRSLDRFRLRANSGRRPGARFPPERRRRKLRHARLPYGELLLVGADSHLVARDPVARAGRLVIDNVISLDRYRQERSAQRLIDAATHRHGGGSPPTTAS